MSMLVHISSFTDEWKMHSAHKELILEYSSDVFEVPHGDFMWFKDDNGYTHLMVYRNHPSLKDKDDAEIASGCTYIDGFVWGLSYAQLKRKKKNSESQSSECKGTENNE